jgi:DNA-binding IclR family transcriptional regulator
MTDATDDDVTVRSVRRALAILRAFTATDRSLPLSEIANRTKLDKGTARRLLRTLIAERLIEQDEAGSTYSLGVGVLELAGGITPCDDLRQVAQPVLAGIAAATGATTFLGVVHDGAALCIARADSVHPIQIRAWSIGGRLALNCGAGPRTLLASLSAEQQARVLAGELPAMTPATPADAAQLREILQAIRARGWELGVDDVVEGIVSLAAPVRSPSGAIIATVSIAGLTAHMVADGRPRHLEALRTGVRTLESRLPGGVSNGATRFVC